MEFTYNKQLTKVVFGVAKAETVGQEVEELGIKKILVITDKGIRQASFFDTIINSLSSTGIDVAVFDEVEANPTDKMTARGAECAKDEKAEAVIGCGGGSSIDAAKTVAVLMSNDGPIEKYFGGFDLFPNPPKPIIAIPTTAGTGSEVSMASMVTNTEKGTKMGILGLGIVPAVAIVDPQLTVSQPPRLTAQTGMDALVHAIEAHTSNIAMPITDAISWSAMQLIVANLRKAYANGDDLEARSGLMLGSTMAGMAFTNVNLGIVHSLGHAISGQYDSPHGLTMSICLPFGLEFNVIAVPDKYARIAELLGEDVAGLSTLAAARRVVNAVTQLTKDLEIEDTLKTIGVEESSFPSLADICMTDNCTFTNSRKASRDDIIRLYQRMYDAPMKA